MAKHRQKSLCKRLTRSVVWLTAILVALSCAIGYWLMARALLSERQNYMRSEISRQAEQLQLLLSNQMVWLNEAAIETGKLFDPKAPDSLLKLLQERERVNGNLVHLRAYIGDTIYENGQMIDAQERSQEDWIVQGQRSPSYLSVEFKEDGPLLSLATPIQLGEQPSGVLAADFPLQDLLHNVSRIRMMDGGYALLLDDTGTLLSHPAESAVKSASATGFTGYQQITPNNMKWKDYDGKSRYFFIAQLDKLNWKLLYAVDLRTLLLPIEPVLWMLAGLVVVSAGLAALLMNWRLEVLEEPLRDIGRAAQEMTRGRYHYKIHYAADDEFGQVCRELEHALQWTAERVDDVSHTLGRMSQGDFTVTSESKNAGDFLPIWEAVQRIGDAMHMVFKQVNLTAKWALGGSHQVSGVLGRMSVGIESQSTSVEELNKAATLLRHESNQNALNASRAQESALMVTSELRSGDQANSEMRTALQKVADAVRGLDTLLGEVHKYAANGRMLSISASAEAERIGEQAQAFVLTVDELREMFLGAMKSAKEAADKISLAKDAVIRAQECVGHTSDVMKRVVQKNGQTAEYVGRIASASQLQAQAATKMSKEVSVISVVIQSNSQLAEQFDLSCGSLSSQAKLLSEMASSFYTKGESTEDEKSAPIIFDEGSGGFSVS